MTARDLLAGLLLLMIVGFAWRGRGPPSLGPPHPAPTCARPVEIIGEGVSCDGDGGAPVGARIEPGPLGRAERVRGAESARVRVRGRMAPARLQAFAAPVDLNRANAAELASLDGIGARLAQRIILARPFATVEDLARVRGIGPRRMAELRPRLRVTPATTANVGLDE